MQGASPKVCKPVSYSCTAHAWACSDFAAEVRSCLLVSFIYIHLHGEHSARMIFGLTIRRDMTMQASSSRNIGRPCTSSTAATAKAKQSQCAGQASSISWPAWTGDRIVCSITVLPSANSFLSCARFSCALHIRWHQAMTRSGIHSISCCGDAMHLRCAWHQHNALCACGQQKQGLV